MIELEIGSGNSASVTELEAIYARYCGLEEFPERLTVFARDGSAPTAATWLLKKHLENCQVVASGMSRAILDLFPQLHGWQSRLHILQCFQFLDLSAVPVRPLRAALLPLLADSNIFVRAWAHDGLYRLALLQHDDAEADLCRIHDAARTESPAVRARLRRLLKQQD